MMDWIVSHWLDLAAGAAVLGLVALSLKNILPGKSACSGCSGSCGSCGGCSGSCPSCHK